MPRNQWILYHARNGPLSMLPNIHPVSFFPKHVQMPKISSEDRLAATLEDLSEILKKTHPRTPFLQQGTTTNDAIRKITEIFHPPKSDTVASPRVIEPATTKRKDEHADPRKDENYQKQNRIRNNIK